MARKSEPWNQYWVYYRVYSHSVLQTIQKKLGPLLPDEYIQVETDNYHVTVHPQFQFPESESPAFESVIRDTFPKQITITSDDFHFYPSKSKPRVICLDVSTNIPFESKQNDLVSKIKRRDGKSMRNPTYPHITLFLIDDSHNSTMKLPSNIDEIYRECDEIIDSELPVTFKETELHFKSLH